MPDTPATPPALVPAVIATGDLGHVLASSPQTTLEKMSAIVGAIALVDVATLPDEFAQLGSMLTLAAGFGFDPFDFLPSSDADADQLVDKCICMLLELRGDDLPPFDVGRYGEAIA